VIHRDLSPRNVMLSRDGEVKLVDFGIAVTLADAAADAAGESAPTGSFPYMSPEQVRKQPLTGQTDLFSVGVLLWEMLVGQRLFARSDPDATLRAVTDGDIARPSATSPDVPARLDDVVMRALERDPAARWPSAADMLAALQRYLYSLDETPGPRDVAALVARHCPPETRRLPTHHDELERSEVGGGDPAEPPRPRPWTASPEPTTAAADPPRPGPATAVISRDGAARGKRPSRARTETFATHVELAQILRAAPDGPSDDGAGSTATAGASAAVAPPGEPAAADTTHPAEAAAAAEAADPAQPIPRPELPPLTLPGRAPPTTGLLIAAAVGALALGGAAIFAFFQGGAAVLRPDAAPEVAPDPRLAGPDAAVALGAPVDAGAPALASPPAPPDAGPAHHAPHPLHLDAGAGAAIAPPVRLDAGRPTGTATLTVGATPWGTVLLDGKPLGRTPIDRVAVPAGHHVVSVTFGGEDPPRMLSYPIDLAAGDARDVFADFTHP